MGDLPNLPGTATLAALGAASLGVNYVKASLYGLKTADEAIFMMQNIVKTVKDQDASIRVVVTGYADADRVGSVNPLLIPKIAIKAGCDLAMVDTAIKDNKNLLTFLNIEQLERFVVEAHGYGLKAALAGSLKKENLSLLCGLGVDVIGLRGAACTDGDRVYGHITRKGVRELTQIVRNAESHAR